MELGGIRAGINMVYPYARWQLCYTRKLRDVSKSIRHKAKNRREMMFQASKIYKYDFSDDKDFISTTNHLERELEEIRRRIKVKGILNRNKALLFGYMVS